ncbi:hypothetical protein ACE3MQ_12870 [Paenibacillus lentus]|uniref:hypothetical protein n=1 Tax=Paenibacillus lentus TaxID=1338368 RepID=UPI003669F46D
MALHNWRHHISKGFIPGIMLKPSARGNTSAINTIDLAKYSRLENTLSTPSLEILPHVLLHS